MAAAVPLVLPVPLRRGLAYMPRCIRLPADVEEAAVSAADNRSPADALSTTPLTANELDYRVQPRFSGRGVGPGRFRWLSLAVVAGVLLAGCWLLPRPTPSAAEQIRAAAALRRVFPILEELRVTDYRNQDWCKNLAYARGWFSSNLESSTCNLFNEVPIGFDSEAQADFRRVARALRDSGVSVDTVGPVQYDSAGRVARAHFFFAEGGYESESYVFDPSAPLPEDSPGEATFTRIDQDWYLAVEDWN